MPNKESPLAYLVVLLEDEEKNRENTLREAYPALFTPAIIEIFDQYAKKGGKSDKLFGFLVCELTPQPSPQLFRYSTTIPHLNRLAVSIQKFLIKRRWPLPLKNALGEVLYQIQECRGVWRAYQDGSTMGKRKPRPGQPKGPTQTSLALAVLSYEFSRHFKKPCYKKIWTLAQAIDPKRFQNVGKPEETIRKRIKSVPHDLVVHSHAQFFS